MLLLALTLGCQSKLDSRPLPTVDVNEDDTRFPNGNPGGDGPGGDDTDAGDTGIDDTGPTGPGGDDTETEDTGHTWPDPGDDTGGDDTGTGGTTSETNEVCYPGADESWTTCIPVVDWSSGWGADYSYPAPYGGDLQYSAPARYVDLSRSTANPSLALAPNFVLDEFMQEWKGTYGVFQSHVVAHMQDIRDRVGGAVSVNSGYRNVTYNAGVGGAEYSRHQYGDAVDFYSSSASLGTLEDYCYDEGAGYVGLYDTHIHCDWRDDPLDTAFYDVSSLTGPISHDEFVVDVIRGAAWEVRSEGWDEGEPLKVWRALDADGEAIEEVIAPTYEPPAEAVRVELTVGGHFVIVMDY